MLVLQYTFTRPNTSVNFYSASEDASVVSAIIAAQDNGDILSFDDSISSDGLVMTRIVNVPSEDALARLNATAVLATNKQARTAYNNSNGITESVTQGTA